MCTLEAARSPEEVGLSRPLPRVIPEESGVNGVAAAREAHRPDRITER